MALFRGLSRCFPRAVCSMPKRGFALSIAKPTIGQLSPPPCLLTGPGPCNTDPRILTAMALPTVGHLDPFFLEMMEEVKKMLRYVWQTNNDLTIPISGTGSAAMEACVCNMVERGDKVVIGCNGYFGNRLVDMAQRYGGDVVALEKTWGQVFSLKELTEAVEKHKPKVLMLVHAETSTGARQPLEGVGDLCRKHNVILVADTVTSISGLPVLVDEWKLDAVYAGTQKCMSCPPGVSPVTFNERAMAKLKGRKEKVPNWYLDLNMIASYLVAGAGGGRVYHHTAPINSCYGIREALTLICEEGLENRWKRHQAAADMLWEELEKMGLKLLVDRSVRLPSLTTLGVPEGIDEKKLRGYLLEKYKIELGAGLGIFAGKAWRIGLMGYNARPDVVLTVVSALRDALAQQGYKK